MSYDKRVEENLVSNSALAPFTKFMEVIPTFCSDPTERTDKSSNSSTFDGGTVSLNILISSLLEFLKTESMSP